MLQQTDTTIYQYFVILYQSLVIIVRNILIMRGRQWAGTMTMHNLNFI